ncbi:MAG: hypothetical protein IPO83_09445 [Chitinophagaceae bacterium]|nr:hypothetical protein [Chitinophagaceae bacterium]
MLLLSHHQAKAQISSDSTAVDSVLLIEMAKEMEAAQETSAAPRAAASPNPDISAIGDFQGSYNSEAERNFDWYLHEAEVSLQAVVDPYVRADLFLSFGRDPETLKYGVDVEEGYLTTLSLPAKLQLKVGKFRQALGRINPVHPHALPFIDMPNAFVNYFGEEGLNDEGISLSWLIPNHTFYQELTFQATAGFSETPSFERSNGNQFVYLGHLKNFWDLTPNATLEFGISAVTGPNDSSGTTNIAAADLTYKWKPVQLNTYHSLTWQTEFFYSNANFSENNKVNSFGLYSFITYQLAKRWMTTLRYDYSQQPYSSKETEQAASLTFEWYATEFQKIGLEGKVTDPGDRDTFFEGWLRWIFIIGSHGAHQY